MAADRATRATLTLARPVPAELAGELARRLYFVSPEIAGFELVETDGEVRTVTLRLERPADEADLRRKLDAVVASDVLDQRRPPARQVWQSARRDRPQRTVFAELVEAGVASVAGTGQVVLAEPMVTLIDRLDAALCDLAVTVVGPGSVRPANCAKVW